MKSRNVLISGAGIAGPALAYWLRRHGFTPVVVEQAPAPRRGGHAVDVRGTALEVAERMGILAEVRAARTDLRGMSVVDGTGAEVMRTTEGTFTGGRFDGPNVEILREDLVRILLDRTAGEVEYVFGDSITALEQDARGVRVAFERAAPRRVDLVIGADGVHSAVRRLVFGPDREYVHRLGTYLGIFTTDNVLGLDRWQLWYRNGDLGCAVYPARGNTELRVFLAAPDALFDGDPRDPEQGKRFLAERFAEAGWEIPRLLKAMWEGRDCYFDAVSQVRMDRWWNGRVALLGDAGYCASPMSGQGTSLALVGAYVLAAELAAAEGDHTAAFPAYQERLAGFAEASRRIALKNQQEPTALDPAASDLGRIPLP